MAFLAGGELQPEEEGEADSEYQPNMDMSNMSDDDDSLYSAGTPHSVATSCLSTPDVRGLATPTNTDTPDGFKRPRDLDSSVHSASRTLNFDISPPLQRTYSTRSRNPMTDTRIEDIEQQFVPFDITPDMYDPVCDTDDYGEFLKELYGGSNMQTEYNEEEDQEFVYCPDEADEQTADPEELRNDKATKVTKKEVAELMSELLEFADSSMKVDDEKKKKKKKKVPLPGDQIFEAIKSHTKTVKVVPKETAAAAAPTASAAAIPELSCSQRAQLEVQLSQHIQLVSQMALLSSHSPVWRGVRAQCDTMLGEVVQASLSPGSVAAQSNLYTRCE